MIIVDAHLDIAFNALNFARDYRRGAAQHRRIEAGSEITSINGIATIGLPDALVGGIAVIGSTLFTEPAAASAFGFEHLPMYTTAREAHDQAMTQLDYYRRLEEETDQVRIIRRRTDLDAVLATWAPGQPLTSRQVGFVILMENADPILEPKQFEEWYELGVRIVGLTWSLSRYAHGTGHPGGITRSGRDLLSVMAGFNAILDLSHMAEQAFYEAIDVYDGVIVASHSNPRKFRNTDRHLSDAMIRALAERDGVVGVVPYNRFLVEDWLPTLKDNRVPLIRVVDVIDHICQVTGSSQHVGVGSDFDGGFGAEAIPDELDTHGDLVRLADALRHRGYAEADIVKVMSGNMLRLIERALPV